MRQKTAGSGLEIDPPLGIGTWAWGERMFWGYGGSYGETDVQGAFDTSLAAGIHFFDTAEAYGRGESERLLGRFIRAGGQPAVVATKFFPYPWRLSGDSLISALRASLQRLGLDAVDLYQVHWPVPPVSIESWMHAMADAVEAGMTRAVGVSNYNLAQMRRAHAALARRGVPLASNQVEYSLVKRQPEHDGVLAACRQMEVRLIAYSPLAQGLLTGKYGPDSPPPGIRGLRVRRARLAKIQPLVALLRDVGARHGKTPGQVALNWIICKGAVPIPGAKNARQAQENAGAVGWRLSDDEVAMLDRTSQAI